MSRIDASTTAVLVSNVPTIQLYKYEPFSNTFKLGASYIATDTLSSAGTGADIQGYVTNVSSSYITFSSSNGPAASVSGIPLVITDLCGTTTMQALNYIVNIGAGRFTQPIPGTSLTMYRNEPAFYNDSLASKTFVASIPIADPVTTSPALPTGLSFVGSGTTYDLSGTPILQSPTRDYIVIGRGSVDPGRVVTTSVRLTVAPERMVVDVSGSKFVTDMVIGSNIVERAMFSRCPPYPLAGSNIFYSWNALPDGLYFADASGSPVSSPYLARDSSSTLLLKGTPTEYAARTMEIPFVTTVVASRRTLPAISFNVQYSFSFVPTVLFDPLGNFTPQYVKASSTLSNRFFAYTRFAPGNVTITDISTVTPLPEGLDLSFTLMKSEAYIVGRPSNVSSANYTVRAKDSSNNTQDISFNLTVVKDSITFNPLDTSLFTFAVARALSNALPGYYPYPIQFSGTSAAGCNISYASANLPNGISLGTNGRLTGTPTTVSGRATYEVVATTSGTDVSSSTFFDASVIPETFTWPSQTLALFQNIAITPIQFRVQTQSERPVISFSSSTAPSGLTLSSTGRLSGTPTSNVSGTMLITANNGIAVDTRAYPYTVASEIIVLYTALQSYPLVPGIPPGIQVNSVAYSGKTVSNFRFSNLDTSYGLAINPTTGVIGGTPSSDIYYITNSNVFNVKGSVGLADGQLGVKIITTDYYRLRYFAGAVASSNFKCLHSDLNPYTWQPSPGLITAADSGGGNDFQIANGVFLTPVASTGGLYRSTNGNAFSNVLGSNVGGYPCISATVNKTGTNTWWGVGVREFGVADYRAALFTSIDNGATWDVDTAPQLTGPATAFLTRDNNTSNTAAISNVTDVATNAYLRAGAAMSYKNDVLMAGGLFGRAGFGSAVRSTDYGATWSNVPTSFAIETAFINTDNSGIWVMTGSDLYSSAVNDANPFTENTTTIRYSTDQGETWSPATGGFNMNAYNITYACNTWIATGLDCFRGDVTAYTPGSRFSIDGSNWSLIQLPVSNFNGTYRYVPPLPISPYFFDGSWNTIVENEGMPGLTLYTHDICATTFTNSVNWVGQDVTGQFDIGSRLTYTTSPTYATPGTPSSVIEFPSVGTGPLILSPAPSYLFYQFVPIEPIVFASSIPEALFFVTGLPIGFAYNPVTQTLTGTPSQLGNAMFQVTVTNGGTITTLTVSITVVIPRVVRPQTGAGAYTSLVRQYVEVNAAQNSRDGKVLPGEPLGEFMAPPAPDNISDVMCCPPN